MISTIVLIEDNPGDLRWFHIICDEAGVTTRVDSYNSGLKALEAFARTPPPDLIISDQFLPILDFPELVERVRATPGYERTPIAILSGMPVDRELQDGVFCCLLKPVTVGQLQSMLARLYSSRGLAAGSASD